MPVVPYSARPQPDFAALSSSDQARAKALFGDFSFPRVAQPAFITMSLREYDDLSACNLVNTVFPPGFRHTERHECRNDCCSACS